MGKVRSKNENGGKWWKMEEVKEWRQGDGIEEENKEWREDGVEEEEEGDEGGGWGR